MKKLVPLILGCLLVAISCKKTDLNPLSSDEDLTATLHSGDNAAAGKGPQRTCAAHDVLMRQIATDPERGRRLEALERIIQERTAAMKGKPGGGGTVPPPVGPVTIPVVFHVVLPDDAVVSSTQIQSQLDVLNNDFQRLNSELQSSTVYLAGNSSSIAANCQITFKLQQVVRRSNPAVPTFGSNDAVKYNTQGGSNAVSPTSMLNVWVCDLSSGLLGYAQFPGGNVNTDGVVIDYQAFGNTAGYTLYKEYNQGRTATHEIGHWLNLRHIWGDSRCGDDLVGDTPQHEGANYGCPSTSDASTCKGKSSLDMWMNYMDYTDDRCMYMFTQKQKERVDVTLANARKAYYY